MANNVITVNGTRSYNVPESWMGPFNALFNLVKVKAVQDRTDGIVPRTLPKRTLPNANAVVENPLPENPNLNPDVKGKVDPEYAGRYADPDENPPKPVPTVSAPKSDGGPKVNIAKTGKGQGYESDPVDQGTKKQIKAGGKKTA